MSSESIVHYLDNGIERTEILNSKSKFIVCGYWWGRGNINKNSVHKLTYDQQVDRLVSQCKKLNINYYFVEYPIFATKGMYMRALNLKIQFIINSLNKFPNLTVITMDTDLNILKYPIIFEMDVDCFFINWNMFDTHCFNPYQIILPGGIMGFANSYNAKVMLKMFNKHLLKHPDYAEDKMFSQFITSKLLTTYLRCVWLPLNYMYMYQNHKYTPYVGYTQVVNLKQELSNTSEPYTPKDIVIEHIDFETGALDDVYSQRVTKNRFPRTHYKEMGKKLRCLDIQFINYLNYNTTIQQCKHNYKDTLDLVKEHRIKNELITFISKNELSTLNKQIINIDKTNFQSTNHVVIITLCDNTIPPKVVDSFKNNCIKLHLNFIIIYVKNIQEISLPQIIYQSLLQYKINVTYINIYTQIKKYPELINVKNMDFMTINLDYTHLPNKKCADIRVLQTVNNSILFFAYNHVILDFLSIWNTHNKISNYQYKYLEYSFNISMSINKLRCYWTPREYFNGAILHYPKSTDLSLLYPNKNIKYTTNHLRQCGNKPPLKYDNPLPTHFHGSGVHGTTFHNKYGKLFLQFN